MKRINRGGVLRSLVGVARPLVGVGSNQDQDIISINFNGGQWWKEGTEGELFTIFEDVDKFSTDADKFALGGQVSNYTQHWKLLNLSLSHWLCVCLYFSTGAFYIVLREIKVGKYCCEGPGEELLRL